MKKLLAVAIALFLGLGPAVAQQSPFSGRKPADETTAPATEEQRPASPFGGRAAAPTEDKPLITLPAPMRAVFRWVADQQRTLNDFMGDKLRESKGDGGFVAALVLLGASFLYGVLHAAGPGHGKLVVASYFTARQAPLTTGILMGTIIAATQAVVAILAVGVLAVLIGRRQMDVMNDVNVLEIISYGIIFVIGAYMTYCALRGREAFGHDHGPPASTFDEPPPAEQHERHHDHGHHDHGGHDHDHHHHDHHNHNHGHGHGHGHEHGHGHKDEHDHAHDGSAARQTWLARTSRAWFGRYGEVLAVGVVSGIRPCSGSILVLLFALANGVFMLGVAAAFLIALGVMITISVLGIGTIVLRRAVAGGGEAPSPGRATLGRVLAVGGSAGVMILGGLLMGGALQAYGVI